MPGNNAQPSRLRVAVISDLHAHAGAMGDPEPSFLSASDPENKRTHPIRALKSLIRSQSLTADLVLCPGDIADKADPAAAKYGWTQLQEVASALSAEDVVATAGNHDLDSRYQYNSYDAKGMLQSLEPIFPTRDLSLSDQYWARNYFVYQQESYRILVINSAAYHGLGPNEYQHGRVSPATLGWLERELETNEAKPLNVLLCHHHPHRHGDIEEDDYSAMKGGSGLLDLLERSAQSWMVIHGHKHHPRIAYAAGGSSSAIVFGAGSFSATLYPQQQTHARNQFYIVDIQSGPPHDGTGCVQGQFWAWDWVWERGWYQAQPGSGLPHRGGFGYRGDIRTLADRVAQLVYDTGAEFMRWDCVLKSVPDLAWLLPSDQYQLVKHLSTQYGAKAMYDENGQPYQLAITS